MTTLVLIPGLASDAVVWRELADAAPLPSHAADLTRDASIAGMAQRLLAETEGRLVAIGHSMGGRVAMEMAHQAPQRLAGLVLANTGHQPRREGEQARRQRLIDLAHADIEQFADAWLPPMLDPARIGDAVLMAALRAMVRRAGAAVHERQIGALLGRPDAMAYIPAIACPILLIAAQQDGWSPIAQHREIAAAAPDAELAIIENAGHFAPLERPEEVTSAIMGWLDRRFGAEHA
ncbi:alpha/beta fold hydrolase [Devosia sp. Root635]|uniref:alpha/beta fold hydrolase n=1 Tax=Devosia sp. Root635 TaxID=1736575 RepID=UPI00070078CC|nr:alpha/beta hydrolase [Devosia sp. Root635]KRA47410.1 alpha/beta hydrolase [Devosia sp. Root635]